MALLCLMIALGQKPRVACDADAASSLSGQVSRLYSQLGKIHRGQAAISSIQIENNFKFRDRIKLKDVHPPLALFDLEGYDFCLPYVCYFSPDSIEVRETIRFTGLNACQIQEVNRKLVSKYRAAAVEPWKPVSVHDLTYPERMYAEMVRMSVNPILVPRPESIYYSGRRLIR